MGWLAGWLAVARLACRAGLRAGLPLPGWLAIAGLAGRAGWLAGLAWCAAFVVLYFNKIFDLNGRVGMAHFSCHYCEAKFVSFKEFDEHITAAGCLSKVSW